MIARNALKYPSPWPPPEPLESSVVERLFAMVPLIGWAAWFVMRYRRLSPYRATLASIESQIKDQLARRSRVDYWIAGSARFHIVKLLESAIAHEKDLSNVCLHPDDPIELVCWGPDDLSLLMFSFDLKQHYGIALSKDDCTRLLWGRYTVSELLDYCCDLATARGFNRRT